VRKQKKQLEEWLKKVNMKNKLTTMLKSHQNLFIFYYYFFKYQVQRKKNKKNLQFGYFDKDHKPTLHQWFLFSIFFLYLFF
jgi:hypothetical protein